LRVLLCWLAIGVTVVASIRLRIEVNTPTEVRLRLQMFHLEQWLLADFRRCLFRPVVRPTRTNETGGGRGSLDGSVHVKGTHHAAVVVHTESLETEGQRNSVSNRAPIGTQ
jgi:hypothetical protein